MIDRRKALKNMGASFGLLVATPTLLGLLQSCKQEATISWVPEFLTTEEGSVLTHLVDLILPKTDTPSASEVQVHRFIDKYAHEILEPHQQQLLKTGMAKFTEKALQDSGKKTIADLDPENLEPVLQETLRISKADQDDYFKLIQKHTEALRTGQQSTLDDGASRFAFAHNIRKLAIWSYKTSEYVGENVLVYLPVPGEYIGCGNLQELTGGKAWSI